MTSASDRAAGVLLGLAAGDAIGGPLQMALQLGESLQEAGGFSASRALSGYLAWWQRSGFDTGPTAAAVFSWIAQGKDPAAAAAAAHARAGGMTAGCNPAHRCPPLAMCASLADDALAEAARAEAALTHSHPLAGDVAAGVAMLCRALVRGAPWREAREIAAIDRLSPTAAALLRPHAPAPGGFAPAALNAAIVFLDAADSFEDALQAALGFDEANYCGVLVGAIGGARWGADAVPAALLARCADRERTQRVARALAAGWVGL